MLRNRAGGIGLQWIITVARPRYRSRLGITTEELHAFVRDWPRSEEGRRLLEGLRCGVGQVPLLLLADAWTAGVNMSCEGAMNWAAHSPLPPLPHVCLPAGPAAWRAGRTLPRSMSSSSGRRRSSGGRPGQRFSPASRPGWPTGGRGSGAARCRRMAALGARHNAGGPAAWKAGRALLCSSGRRQAAERHGANAVTGEAAAIADARRRRGGRLKSG